MKGLELARGYYEACAKELLKERFPALFDRMTIGLAGEGSECFGFDDDYSRDADFGPAFCIWLDGKDYLRYGQFVQQLYDDLPVMFEGYWTSEDPGVAVKKRGVLCTPVWYEGFTGFGKGPRVTEQWLRVSDFSLAAATNGQIFKEGKDSAFMEIRRYLQAGYPEDIRLKRIAMRAVMMGQAGQANYRRSYERGEYVAAALAAGEFAKAGLCMVYLLNHAYAPYYKWLHRGLKGMEKLPRSYELFDRLAKAAPGPETEELIERICALVIAEMKRQSLTDRDSSQMTAHCGDILDRIKDQRLRDMPMVVR